MREVRLRDAKATLSSVIADAIGGRPTIITRYGKREAIILGIAEWQRLANIPSFARLLIQAPLTKNDLPERNRTPICPAEL